MNITRLAQAQAYAAPHHHGVCSLRLQGQAAGGSQAFWTGLSHILPGGGAGPDASALEKVYIVLAGELTVTVDGQSVTLGPLDSCCIAGGEIRELVNAGKTVATMLVVMPSPAAAP